jgi:hypothetical protein
MLDLILSGLGNQIKGAEDRRQLQAKRQNELIREGFDVTPEQQGEGTGAKLMAGLFGGTSDPTTRATMSERHPFMQQMKKQEEDESFRQKQLEQQRVYQNATLAETKRMNQKLEEDRRDRLTKDWFEAIASNAGIAGSSAQGALDELTKLLPLTDDPNKTINSLKAIEALENAAESLAEGTWQDFLLPDFFPGGEQFVQRVLSDPDSIFYNKRVAPQLAKIRTQIENLLTSSTSRAGMGEEAYKRLWNVLTKVYGGKIPEHLKSYEELANEVLKDPNSNISSDGDDNLQSHANSTLTGGGEGGVNLPDPSDSVLQHLGFMGEGRIVRGPNRGKTFPRPTAKGVASPFEMENPMVALFMEEARKNILGDRTQRRSLSPLDDRRIKEEARRLLEANRDATINEFLPTMGFNQ